MAYLFFIARLHSLVPTLLTLVVKHADIKTKMWKTAETDFISACFTTSSCITAIAHLPKSHISPDIPGKPTLPHKRVKPGEHFIINIIKLY